MTAPPPYKFHFAKPTPRYRETLCGIPTEDASYIGRRLPPVLTASPAQVTCSRCRRAIAFRPLASQRRQASA